MKFQGPIIVVDDDPDDHIIFKTVFENLGITSAIKYFDNGTSVLDYLRNTLEEPFIIFCDINMPRISGLDLRENIYEEHALRRKNIPFVFLSNAATPKQVNRAYELTVQGYFTKSSSFQETEKKIRLVLQYWAECEHPNLKKEYRISENHFVL
jgi:DNA-binding NarL/FixJ family response regulator